MEKYLDLFKSTLLFLVSTGILIYMFRKKSFFKKDDDMYHKSLDFRFIVILSTGVLVGVILMIKELKRL